MTIQSCHLQLFPTWNTASANLGQFKQGRDQEGGMLEKHTHRHSDIGVQRVWNSIIILFNHNQTKYSTGFYQELVWTVFLSRTSWAITQLIRIRNGKKCVLLKNFLLTQVYNLVPHDARKHWWSNSCHLVIRRKTELQKHWVIDIDVQCSALIHPLSKPH